MDELVYARLRAIPTVDAVVEDRINPVMPDPDSGLPSLYYYVTSTEDSHTLDGADDIRKATYAFDMLHEDPTVIAAVFDAIRADFKDWRTDDVRGAFPVTTTTVPEDMVYHGQLTYSIWFRV